MLNQKLDPPAGFTLERFAGGFSAWSLEFQTLQQLPASFNFEITLTARLIHQGWSSAPQNWNEFMQTAIIEVSIENLTSEEPDQAVQIIDATIQREGGSNRCSGAISWHFNNSLEAIGWLLDVIKDTGGRSK